MAAASITHTEEWHLTIIRDEPGEPWPPVELPHGRPGRFILPDTITARIARDHGVPEISASGHTPKQDGTPGLARRHVTFWKGPPEWIQELVEQVRKAHGLGPGATGCGW